MKIRNKFSEDEIKSIRPNEKIALVATINENNLPHVTLLTSLLALNENKMAFGEFSRGLSKEYIKTNNKIGFCILTLKMDIWRGKALYTHSMKEGKEYEMFNEFPMFRYNTYFGINTVHFLDLIEANEKERLPFLSIAKSYIGTFITCGFAKQKKDIKPLNTIAYKLFNRLDALKFISWIGNDGYPKIVPALQARAIDEATIVFSPYAYFDELKELKEGKNLAIYAVTLKMENILTRAIFRGFKNIAGIKLAICDIDYVYNSMPPAHGQIYPEIPIEQVREF